MNPNRKNEPQNSSLADVFLLNPFAKLRKRNKILFTILVGTAVILFWRGVWGLADELIFPENYLYSSFVSTFIALIILVLLGVSLEKIT